MSLREKNKLARQIAMGLIIATNSCMAGVAMAGEVQAAGTASIENTTLPTDGKVVYGDAKIETSEASVVMDINQTSNSAIINWDSFNVGKAATVNFNHMTSSGAMNPAGITLNRVVGNDMSQIYGKINAIGSVILINPNGAVFAEGSEVNAAGIIVSTEDLGVDQANFKNGTYIWSQKADQNANITILGTLNASTNGNYLNSGDYANHLRNLTALKIKDLQPATGFSYGNNKIMLIADGDVAVGKDAKLLATTTTHVSGGGTVGSESFSVGGDGSSREGAIIIRADQNADDVALVDSNVANAVTSGTNVANGSTTAGYNPKNEAYTSTSRSEAAKDTDKFKTAKVYLGNDSADQLQSLNVSVYYDSDIVNGVNGTKVSTIGVNTTSADKTFTQKDYTDIGTETSAYKAKVMQTDLYTYANTAGTATNISSKGSIKDQTYASLVNNVYQLQAIQDTSDVKSSGSHETLPEVTGDKKGFYGNLGGSYAQGISIDASDTANWTDGSGNKVGFNPIGYGVADVKNINQTAGAFTGSYHGSGGSNSYAIYDMTINRSSEDYVGLFARTANAYVGGTAMVDSNIVGQDKVGGIAGYGYNTFFDGDTTRKRYAVADGKTTVTPTAVNVQGRDYVGGIAGQTSQSSTRSNSNGAYISGVNHVGGLIGAANGNRDAGNSETTYVSYDGKNRGWYSTTENLKEGIYYGRVEGAGNDIGGLVGSMTDGTITGYKGSYSNGQVLATGSSSQNVGGLVGSMNTSTGTSLLQYSYNTNEHSTLTEVVTAVGDKSVYGQVVAANGTNVGGLVGYLQGANSTISESYNAGNITGKENVGGVVGRMDAGKVEYAYNADNNTVLKTSTNDAEYYGFTYFDPANNTTTKYTYDQATQTWTNVTENKTGLSTEQVLTAAPESGRTYNNRLAYRDATVKGNTNVGGVAGYMTDGTLAQTYNAGQVQGVEAATTGTLIGKKDNGTAVADTNFVVTTDKSQEKTNITSAANNYGAIGGWTAGDSNSEAYEKTLYQATNIAGGTGVVAKGVTWTGSDNQNDQWMVYANSATPLLKHFMTWININRQYVYDGTVHNLMTTDVANYYGGSFFTNGKGQNVHTEGVDNITGYNGSQWVQKTNQDGVMASTSDDTSHSSLYSYDESNMWSPQHGYYTDKKAGLIITPKKLTATVTGEKTYGQVAQGYYYNAGKQGTDTVDTYYVYDSNSKKWEKTTQKPVADEGNSLYELKLTYGSDKTLQGVIGEDGTSILSGLESLVEKSNSADGTGTSGFMYGSDTEAEQKLDAGTKTLSVGGDLQSQSTLKADGTTVAAYNTYNYTVAYKGSLKVDKADLVINASGGRDYGSDNGIAGYTFSAVGTAADAETSKANNGKLKSWDSISTVVKNADDVTNYTLAATENAKQSTGTDAKDISKTTWVAVDASGQKDTYTLGAGSFQHQDVKGNTVSDLISDNYNIIYVGNATDAQVAAATGTATTAAGYLADNKDSNSYDIKPIDLKYDIVGSHTYGDKVATDYTVSAHDASNLKNGDQLSDLVTKVQLDKLAETAIGTAGITSETHVKRDTAANNSTVLAVYDQAVSGNWASGVKLNNGSLNYNLTANKLTYTVNPAEIHVTLTDAAKTYGDTAMTTGSVATISDMKNGETQATAYDASTGLYKGSELTTADSSQKANHQSTESDGVSYKYNGTNLETTANAAAKTYEGAATYSNQNLYFNDYTVIYNHGKVVITPKTINYIINNNTKTYGETVADNAFTGSFDSSAIVTGDSLGTLDTAAFSSTGLNRTAGVGGYAITINSSDKAVKTALGTNYKLGAVTNGTLTVNQRTVDWNTGDAEREYLTANPAFSGSFAAENTEAKTGLLAEDKAKLGTLGQGSYSTKTTVFTSDIGDYSGDVHADGAALQAILGSNYSLGTNTDGKMTITQGNFYYQAAQASYTQNDSALDTAVFTGAVVNRDGLDVTQYLTAADKSSLAFAKAPLVSSASPIGSYYIYGSGISGSTNYRMAAEPQWLTNATALTITSAEDKIYDAAIQPPLRLEPGKDGEMGYVGGGYIPREGRDQIRFLTVEDTGIHLDISQLDSNSITVDKSSRADGGDTVVIDRSVTMSSSLTDDKNGIAGAQDVLQTANPMDHRIAKDTLDENNKKNSAQQQEAAEAEAAQAE